MKPKPKTESEAYNIGYDDAYGRNVGVYWPRETDFEKPCRLVRAFMNGYSDAENERHRNDMSGCQS
jgi:hypothetical protein